MKASLDVEWLTPDKLEDIEYVNVGTAQKQSSYPNSTPPVAFLSPTAAPFVDISPPAPDPVPTTDHSPDMVLPPTPVPCSYALGSLLCRITHSNCEISTNTRYHNELFYSSIRNS